jgi:hypothetical protein
MSYGNFTRSPKNHIINRLSMHATTTLLLKKLVETKTQHEHWVKI